MVHRGKIVENQVRISKYSISKLAQNLGLGRNTVYSKFKDEKLSLDLIVDIGKLIEHDFSNEIPELNNTLNVRYNESSNVKPAPLHEQHRTEQSPDIEQNRTARQQPTEQVGTEQVDNNDTDSEETEKLKVRLKRYVKYNRHLLAQYVDLSEKYTSMSEKYQHLLEKKNKEYEDALLYRKNHSANLPLLQEIKMLRDKYFEVTNKYVLLLEELRKQRQIIDDFLPD